jgi:hypothetical protein
MVHVLNLEWHDRILCNMCIDSLRFSAMFVDLSPDLSQIRTLKYGFGIDKVLGFSVAFTSDP